VVSSYQMVGISPMLLEEDGLEDSSDRVQRTPMIRDFHLGALYNIYEERLYEKNLCTVNEWRNCGSNCTVTKPGIEDTTTFKFARSTEDKMDMFDISGHAKLSVMFEVVKLCTSYVGRYLKESTSSLEEIRFSYLKKVILYTKYIAELPLTPSEEELQKLLDKDYTHYVHGIGITCTTVIMVDFIKTLKKGDDKKIKEAELKANVHSIGWDLDAGGKSNISQKHKDYFDEVRFYYHGTIYSPQVKTSFDGIIDLLNEKILPFSTNYSSCKETNIILKPLDNFMKNENKLEYDELSQNRIDEATRIHNKIEKIHTFFKFQIKSDIVSKLGMPSKDI
jgi:hypothetical protein